MAKLDSAYPIQGSNIPLNVTLKGQDPYPLDGDKAEFLFDLHNPLTRDVTITFETDVNLLGLGGFAGKVAAVAYMKWNGSGNLVMAPSLTVLAGQTVECRADVDFTEEATVGQTGSFALLGTEN